MSAEVKWQDPPPKSRGNNTGKGKYAEIAATLRLSPKRWAVIAEGVGANLATDVKKGKWTIWQPAGSYEAACRKRPDGKYDIYARYVGEDRS